MKKGQKQAVVEAVMTALPNFNPQKDIALVLLSRVQLETIKKDIYLRIMRSEIEYSKPTTDPGEVLNYARSMVMNHLKKARELNGNMATGNTVAGLSAKSKTLKDINMDILPDELKDFVNTLV